MKLNDTQIAELVMKHANGTSISALSKEYEIGRDTVRRYITNNAEIHQKCATIKNETITEWIKNNSSDLAGLLDEIKTEIRGKIKGASVKELFGGLKILTDLGVNASKNEKPTDNDNALDKLCEAIRGVASNAE